MTRNGQPFAWDKQHDDAFFRNQEAYLNAISHKYYKPNKDLTLQCDANDHGLGAALNQEGKPVAFARQTLIHTEKQYVQREKELLAIVYGTEYFHQYTHGRPVKVESDHKPLEIIQQKPLSAAPRHLRKMMVRLFPNDINIVYKKDTEMMLTDTLSRHYLDNTTNKAQGDEQVDSLETINEILLCELTVAILQDHMLRDTELQQVKSFIQSDSPATPKDLEPTISPYFHIDDE